MNANTFNEGAQRDMSITLPKIILEELQRKAGEMGVSIEEYMFDIITKDYDPETAIERYLTGAQQLLEQAREEVKKENLRQASEKIWGSCALAIKAYVLAKLGKRLESHRDLWIYKDEVAEELGDWVKTTFRQANLMHVNFYEDVATKGDVEEVMKEVEKLVGAITKAVTIKE